MKIGEFFGLLLISSNPFIPYFLYLLTNFLTIMREVFNILAVLRIELVEK